MNGIIHYKFDEGRYSDDAPAPVNNLGNCYHELKHGKLRAFFIEGVPRYLNEYPFEIGDDQAPMSEPAEDQIRFAMSVVSNHSERVQIASRAAPQARVIARQVLAEYNQGLEREHAPVS